MRWNKSASLLLCGMIMGGHLTALRQLDAAINDVAPAVRIRVEIDRGDDVGQAWGSLFQATSDDGSLTIGAGFQNLYNTRYRGDRHAIQFFVRPTAGPRSHDIQPLPRPNDLCGTYLYGRDETIRSTYGGVQVWHPADQTWRSEAAIGGTEETMRVAGKQLTLGDSEVRYDGQLILPRPATGAYEMFFYANGQLCFYHIHRGEGGYREYQQDSDGFSKLIACPWTPAEGAVDLTRAAVMTLPIVGETTFAWGTLQDQIVTGSNVGGFYVYEAGKWRTLLSPNLKVSYQLYSTMSFHDRLLMGQYPTGRLFEYDGQQIKDLVDWPPLPAGTSPHAREAQTTVVYGGDVFVGVWPWGELWRYNPDSNAWSLVQRMFDHPQPSPDIIHPYDVENKAGEVSNLWGQRVTSLVTSGPRLFISTSAKAPTPFQADKYPFLAPDKWQSYGRVYEMTMPGQLSAATRWTDQTTTLEFMISKNEISIWQDGQPLGSAPLSGSVAETRDESIAFRDIKWGQGIYGPFRGETIHGTIRSGELSSSR
jgi:hypothetical protein